MSRRLFLLLTLVGGMTWSISAAAAQEPSQTTPTGSRIALLIGNANYPDATAPLAQPARNVRILAGELRRYGFDVDLAENLGKEEMQRAFDALKQKIKPDSEVLLFFSGYGLQFDRESFIIPVNAQIWSENDIRRDGISIEATLSELHGRGALVKLLILDASRRNPYERRFRRAPAGLASIAAPAGTLIVSAASQGKVINDHGPNSIFIGELVKEMRRPGLTADGIFSRTRIRVARATKGEQVLWVASTLVDDFYFKQPSARRSGGPPLIESRIPADSRQHAIAEQPIRSGRRLPLAPRQTEATAPPPASTVPRLPKPGGVFRDCDECPEMVVVPAGTFDMGSNDFPFEKPVHRVRIPRPFAIGRREITFEQWDRCVSAGHCKYRPDDRGQGRGARPATDVSWVDAKAYVAWLSRKTGRTYRLPSEAEWEYVARAGTETPYWWGRDVGRKFANCRDCGGQTGRQSLPAGTFFANPFGLFDTAGNAAEWVEDCWNSTYRNAPRDGSAWTKGQCRQRVLRGGSFDSQARYLRSGSRFRYDADVRYYANGFRVVRDLPR